VFAGDQDRDRAAATLREHYVRGRLTVDELSHRTGRVVTARSRADLRSALAGLPMSQETFGLAGYGRIARTAARGAMLLFFTLLYLIFCLFLLLVFAATLLIHGASAPELAGFLLVWLVPTFLLSRLWRGKRAA
jgi:uncharacterized membrane protein